MPTSQTQSAWPLQKPQQLVYVELGADNGGMMLGICEQGFSYRAVSPLKAEGPLNFTFALDGKTRLQGIGEIVWSEEGGKTGGLKFTTVSAEFRESLQEWLASESTPKSVGREVTPAVASQLDSLSEPQKEVRSTTVEGANQAAPSHVPEVKPVVPKRVESVPAATIVAQPVAEISVEAKLVEPKPAEQKPPEAKLVENLQPEQSVREVEAHIPADPSPRVEPKPVEAIPIETKPEPPKPVEPEYAKPIIPEPEVRSVAPLPPAETPSKSVFSLPNFRLPTAYAPDLPSVPHLPMEEIVQSAPKTVPIEAPPTKPPPEIALPEFSPGFREVISRETETPVFRHEPEPPEFFPEDFIEESPRLNRAAAGGIIGLALAVILAALILSFRREAGEVLIRLGETLSGEERKPAVAQQPASSAASAQTPQPSAAESSKDTGQPATQPSTAQSPKTVDQPSLQTQEKTSSSQQAADAARTQALAADSSSTNVSPSGSPLTNSPSTNNVQRIQDLPPPTDGGNGQKEFEQARNMLRGNHRQRDLSYAVKLLWMGVRKGNVPAEVTLADLFARGDGVARSCAQARVLLEAAIQKGSPEARRRLSLLKQQGCA